MARPFYYNSYPCLIPGCLQTSHWYAIDNRSHYSHICHSHWRGMKPSQQLLYSNYVVTNDAVH